MWLHSFGASLKARGLRTPARRTPPRRRSTHLRLEALEERRLLTLAPAVAYPVSAGPQAIVSADFNNDGRLDLATTGNSSVSLLLGNGDGTFGAAHSVPAPSAHSLAAGDFNGDGNADLVTLAGAFSGDTVWGRIDLLLGNGDGWFQPAREVPISDPPGSDGSGGYSVTSYGPTGIAVADVDADGRSDLWVDAQYSYYYYGDVSAYWGEYSNLLLGVADGSFDQGLTENGPPALPAPDLNADGFGDAVVAADNGVSVRLGRADGALSPQMLFPAGQSPSAASVGDFNDDNRPDVAAANAGSNDVSVLLNDGNWPATDAPTIRVNNVVITEGNTGTRAAVFTLALSAGSDQPITVAFHTADSTATASRDYQPVSDSLTFAPGETSKAITVLVNGDRLGEADEHFLLKLDQPANGFLDENHSDGWCRIEDDEPRINISDVTMKEGNGKKTTLFIFTIMLSAAYDQPVTMSFGAADGTAKMADSDYIAKTGTLTFAPGETTKTITIEVKCDSKKEANETFYLYLFDNSSNSSFKQNRGTGTILNDD